MSEKKQRAEASTAKTKVWTSVVFAALSTVVSMLLRQPSSFADLPRSLGAIGAAAGAVAVLAAFTALLTVRERGTSRVANLKDKLHTAYLCALDASALNPRVREKS